MNTGNLLVVALAFLASAISLNAFNKAPSYAPQIVNTGVSLNQQISSSSLNSKASATNGQFVIAKSGRYFLSTDILAAPAAQIPCIYINASDVVLDLGGKTITLSSTTYQKNSAAISVANGMSDITIMNGTLNGKNSNTYTSTGIKFGTSVSNILVDNVHVVNFGYDGITFDNGCSDTILNNIHTYNIGSAAKSVARGLAIVGTSGSSCNDFTIIDSDFNKTTATTDLRVYGIYATYCNNLSANNVKVSNTAGATGAVRGVLLDNCTGVMCDNVKILRPTTSGAAPFSVGFDLAGSTGCSFVNCSANNGLSSNSTSSAYGFRLANSSNSNTFINCEAKNNLGGGTSAGVSLDSSHYNTFQSCNIIANGGASRLTYGFQSGLNSSSSGTDLTKTCSGSTFKSCKVNNNIATKGNAYGFALSGDTGAAIQDCEIKANASSATCYGIALHHTCIKNIVEYNKIYSNSGTIGKYGFKDFANDSTTFLRGNVAFGHGATFSGGNASITDSTGSMNYFLQYLEASGQMDVQFLIKEADIANMNAFEAGSSTWFNFSILHESIAG
jgi:hypothetical protein